MPSLKESLIAQLDDADALIGRFPLRGSPERLAAATEFVVAALAAIERAAGSESAQSRAARDCATRVLDRASSGKVAGNYVIVLVSILKSVRNDVARGYFDDARTLIHAEVFGDLLDQAAHLLSEGYDTDSGRGVVR